MYKNLSGVQALTLPRLFGDGMILQRSADIKIWGLADAGKNIEIDFADHRYVATANSDDKWEATLPAMEAGGPYDMNIRLCGETESIVIKGVMIGDVWLCSGQSNMELTMDWIDDRYAKEIAGCENSLIRQFYVPQTYNFIAPQEDFESGCWEAANPKSILHFTAVGYFFAKQLFDRLHIPIGIINASVGGSPIEAWMSKESLESLSKHRIDFDEWKDKSKVDEIISKETAMTERWHQAVDQKDEGLKAGEKPYFDNSFEPVGWPAVTMPSTWEDAGLGQFYGALWLRRTFHLSQANTGKPAMLYLGNIIHSDAVYINGAPVGSTPDQHHPRKYHIPRDLLQAGENTIVMRIVTTKGNGGFVKGKPFCLLIGGQTIDLSGDWHYKIGAVNDLLPEPTYFQWKPTGLYNSMIAPLLKTSIKGIAWYQGESNTKESEQYEALFTALIVDWRNKFKSVNLPFLFVQLANFMESVKTPTESNWALVRDAQRRCLKLPKTGMAVAIDLGEWNDIHPSNKKDVGYRLALAAQAVAYQENEIVSFGPNYQGNQVDGHQILLDFKEIGGGLIAKGGGPLKGFAIAGADKKYVWANARIDGNRVIAWSEQVPRPCYVRYAWADNPEGANLYNHEGLPACQFTTEL